MSKYVWRNGRLVDARTDLYINLASCGCAIIVWFIMITGVVLTGYYIFRLVTLLEGGC